MATAAYCPRDGILTTVFGHEAFLDAIRWRTLLCNYNYPTSFAGLMDICKIVKDRMIYDERMQRI